MKAIDEMTILSNNHFITEVRTKDGETYTKRIGRMTLTNEGLLIECRSGITGRFIPMHNIVSIEFDVHSTTAPGAFNEVLANRNTHA